MTFGLYSARCSHTTFTWRVVLEITCIMSEDCQCQLCKRSLNILNSILDVLQYTALPPCLSICSMILSLIHLISVAYELVRFSSPHLTHLCFIAIAKCLILLLTRVQFSRGVSLISFVSLSKSLCFCRILCIIIIHIPFCFRRNIFLSTTFQI